MFPNINLYVQFLLVISKNCFPIFGILHLALYCYNYIIVQIDYETIMLATYFPLQY